MQISSATAESLGEKLATLDLVDEEVVLLRHLIEGEPEVTGFKQPLPADAGIMFETFRTTAAPIVMTPVSDRFKIEIDGYYTYELKN